MASETIKSLVKFLNNEISKYRKDEDSLKEKAILERLSRLPLDDALEVFIHFKDYFTPNRDLLAKTESLLINLTKNDKKVLFEKFIDADILLNSLSKEESHFKKIINFCQKIDNQSVVLSLINKTCLHLSMEEYLHQILIPFYSDYRRNNYSFNAPLQFYFDTYLENNSFDSFFSKLPPEVHGNIIKIMANQSKKSQNFIDYIQNNFDKLDKEIQVFFLTRYISRHTYNEFHAFENKLKQVLSYPYDIELKRGRIFSNIAGKLNMEQLESFLDEFVINESQAHTFIKSLFVTSSSNKNKEIPKFLVKYLLDHQEVKSFHNTVFHHTIMRLTHVGMKEEIIDIFKYFHQKPLVYEEFKKEIFSGQTFSIKCVDERFDLNMANNTVQNHLKKILPDVLNIELSPKEKGKGRTKI